MSTHSHSTFVGLGLVLAFGATTSALADDYPSRPIRVIIPFGAGGSADVLVRIITSKLPATLGQQVVVDNRTGAGGLLGTSLAVKAKPDEYTLPGTGTPHSIIPHLYKDVP